jgi:iron(III) transport system ATP-binding protein
MLAIENLSKVYVSAEGPAGGVREASFALEPGTFFTLLGPSGCGKTTTLRCVAGLEQPDSGTIRVGPDTFFDAARGINVPLNRRGIGMVFQSYAIWPHMTVFENVAFPLRVAKDRRYGRDEIARMVQGALETVSLGGFGKRPATRLSGGQQQRVALARAIVAKPRLLLLDEPLSNLDAALREEMRNELRSLQQQIGVTTVYVTHDQSEALEMSDLIAVMEAGHIVQFGTPRDIYFHPRNTFVARFVGASNWLTGTMVEAGADGQGRIELGDGRTVQCRLAEGRTTVPRAANVAVRPEAVALARPGVPAQPGANRLDGTVVTSGFLGSSNRYRIDLGGPVFEAHGPADCGFGPGDKVAVEFSAAAAIALED